jgi:phenylacetate-CoA ligase
VLTRPGNLDELTVVVESLGEPEGSLEATLAERIKNRVGVTARVEVVAPHSLERSTGKARRIDDRR